MRKRKPLRERIRNIHIPPARYIALAVAGVLVLGGAAYGAVAADRRQRRQRLRRQRPAEAAAGAKATAGAASAAANVDPSKVTVAILNGTTVQGLAAKVGEEVRAGGFTLGTVGNAARIDQTQSQVLYRKGQSRPLAAVANRLGIQSIAPVDSVTPRSPAPFDASCSLGSTVDGRPICEKPAGLGRDEFRKPAVRPSLAALVFAALVVATVGAFFVTTRLKRSAPVIERSSSTGISRRTATGESTTRCSRFRLRRTRRGDGLDRDSRRRRGADAGGEPRAAPRQALPVPLGRAYAAGGVAPDGEYHVRVSLRRQGRVVTSRRKIFLDTTPPDPWSAT